MNNIPAIIKLRFVHIITAVFIISVSFISYAVGSQPTDASNHWAAKDISAAASEGWAYIESSKFNPNKPATREEVVWMLVGACDMVWLDNFDANKKTDMSSFKDKASPWSEDRMAAAIANGLIKGYPDNTIKPKNPITRAEFAVLLSRLVKRDPSPGTALKFRDSIPGWALEGIKKIQAEDIIKGYPDGTFKPGSNVTKAEALVMIKRWKDKVPPPPCDEFRQILGSIPNTEVSINHDTLISFGKQGKTARYDPGKFYIRQEGKDIYTIVLNDFKEDTYADLETALKFFLPSVAGQVVSEVDKLSDYGKKELELAGKNIKISGYGMYVTIVIKN